MNTTKSYNCPICNTSNEHGQIKCNNCGWKLPLYLSTPSKQEKVKLEKKIAEARAKYKRFFELPHTKTDKLEFSPKTCSEKNSQMDISKFFLESCCELDFPGIKFSVLDSIKEQSFAYADRFWISIHPITQNQWCYIMKSNPAGSLEMNKPIVNISALEMQQFCEQLNSGDPEGYYRIPTVDEWEYACRGGASLQKSKTGEPTYCFGSNQKALKSYAWFSLNSNHSLHNVGEKLPNAYGIYDMHGNVEECCLQPHADQCNDNRVWNDISSYNYILKGGCYSCPPAHCRIECSKTISDFTKRSRSVGFRIVRFEKQI